MDQWGVQTQVSSAAHTSCQQHHPATQPAMPPTCGAPPDPHLVPHALGQLLLALELGVEVGLHVGGEQRVGGGKHVLILQRAPEAQAQQGGVPQVQDVAAGGGRREERAGVEWVPAARVRRATACPRVQVPVGSGASAAGGGKWRRPGSDHPTTAMRQPRGQCAAPINKLRCPCHSPEGILPEKWRLAVHSGGGGCRSGGGHTSPPQIILRHLRERLAQSCGGLWCRTHWRQMTQSAWVLRGTVR